MNATGRVKKPDQNKKAANQFEYPLNTYQRKQGGSSMF